MLRGRLNNPETQHDGFPTAFSWGYRIAARADYNNAFGTSFTLSPRVAFNHDVNGTTPGPGGNFVEDRKSLTLVHKGQHTELKSVDQLNKLLSGLDKNAVLTLKVRRGDSMAFVTVNGLTDKG